MIGFGLVVLLLWLAGGWSERGARGFLGSASAAFFLLVLSSFLPPGAAKILVATVATPLAAVSVLLAALCLVTACSNARSEAYAGVSLTGKPGGD